MNHTTIVSERITAILSTAVAVGILAAGVAAQQSRIARTDELVHLESDLRFQLASTFRLNPKEGDERVEQLEAVLASWRQAPQTEVDRRLLADWLWKATVRSMPGSIEPILLAPQFGRSEAAMNSSAPQSVEASPQSSAKIMLVANADVLDQPSNFTPLAATTPVSSASPYALAEQILVDPIPTPGEHPFVEVSTKVASPETQPVTPPLSRSPVAKPVRINLTELTARIAGYHHGLNEVEAALLVHERPQFERLAGQIHSLDGLTKDFQFVRLYYESLTPTERRTIEPPRSVEATLSELYRHLNRLEREVQADFLGEFDTALAERLAHLHNQLDAIASRVEW